MKTIALLAFGAALLVITPRAASAADTATPAGSQVGEIRAFALAPENGGAVAALHHEGWIEAHGQLLPVRSYQALYRTLGRAWTGDGASEDRFAIPDLRDQSQRSVSSDNPFGVLSPGDLVTSSGTARRRRISPVTYWIFTGQDVSSVAR